MFSNHTFLARLRPLALAALLLASALPASAGDRRFTYTYESTTAPKGTIELENWVTWRHRSKRVGKDSDVFRFRHEVEIGLTDRLQLGLYLFDWQYDSNDAEGHDARWRDSGFELIYSLSNPTTDFIGSALYGEILVGEELLKLEGKLILQKNFGPIRVAYNAIIEAEFEGSRWDNFEERNGEFAQTFGVSYDVNKNFSVGAELLHEIALPGWSDAEHAAVYAGPNASVRFGRVFVTVTGLFQITDGEGEPDSQVRLITGFHF